MSNKQPGQLDIQPLPKRLYKQVYGSDYNDSWQLRFKGLSDKEIKAAEAVIKIGDFREVYWIPEIDYPKKKETPDLLIDGQKVEIKNIESTKSARAIERNVKRIAEQLNGSGWGIIDVSKSSLTKKAIMHEVERWGLSKGISRIAVVRSGEVIAYKQIVSDKTKIGGLGTTGYATRDSKLTYIDILPETSKKSMDLASSPDIIKNFKPRKQTNKYWQKRAEARLTESEKITKTYERQVHKVYEEAQRKTVQQLKDMYAAYYKGKEGFDIQALRSIAPTGDIKHFRDEMRKLGLSTYLPDNYKGRISRLELLNAQMWAEVKKAAIKQVDIESTAHRSVYENSYYKTAYDVSKGIGATPASFGALDTQTVDNILSAKFQGKSFSERIWSNTDILAKQLKEKLAVAIATGQSIEKTSREFRERFGVQKYYADRLIRTESNYFHNSAAIESYSSMGIEMFEFLATLDMRTSDVCQSMDGKRFKVKDAVPGVNYPPLHPNCRSCVVPYVKGYEPQGRMYRDPETNKNKYISNISYKDWRQQLVNDNKQENGISRVIINQPLKPISKRVIPDLLERLRKSDIYSLPVAKMSKTLTSEQIINKVGGADKTYPGSCQSAALAYAGNKIGLDVLDFRGGKSMRFFSTRRNAQAISSISGVGGKVVYGYSDFQIASELKKSIQPDKEYILAIARHAAVVRLAGTNVEYAELQSESDNGFKVLTDDVLKKRFSAKNKRVVGGLKRETNGILIDIESLRGNEYFARILCYLNTAPSKQLKGKGGGLK